MGQIRNNQPRAVTEEKLRTLIRELLSREQTAFPSERELAARTGGARGVIRDFLGEMERKNQLLRTANGRIINPRMNRISVLFIGQGRQMLVNAAWQMLWTEFVRQAAATPLDPALLLIGYHPEEQERDLRALAATETNYAIMTGVDQDLLPTLAKILDGRRIVYTDEAFRIRQKTTVALNNREVGRLAANELFRNGYRCPALLSEQLPFYYLPYEERIAGFLDGCRETGMEFRETHDVYPVARVPGKRFQNYIAQTSHIARQKRYDSLFLTTDDELHLVLEILGDQGRPIPGDTGFITVNAQGNAQGYHTRISSISTAETEIAGQLVKSILAHADGEISEIPSVLLPPSVQQGATL